MQRDRDSVGCCGRCAGPAAAARASGRAFYMSAVLPDAAPGAGERHRRGRLPAGVGAPASPLPGAPAGGAAGPGPDHAGPSRVVSGLLLAASDTGVVIGQAGGGECQLGLPPGTAVWRGGACEAGALRPGEQVVVRLQPGEAPAAGKVWAGIGRVAGTIAARDGHRLLVDAGVTRPRQVVAIAPRSADGIRVRFPRLSPGNLIDVIGTRRGTELQALAPATSQPAWLAGKAGGPLPGPGADPVTVSGSVTWHEPGPGEPAWGAAYPAIEPASACAEAAAAGGGCPALPYLAVGSGLRVRNDCAASAAVLPVTGCGPVARLFHDRCLACGTSPRGRVADLTLASFVALGGEPERGCFNATVRAGGRA